MPMPDGRRVQNGLRRVISAVSFLAVLSDVVRRLIRFATPTPDASPPVGPQPPQTRIRGPRRATTRFLVVTLLFVLLLSVGGRILSRRFAPPPAPVLAPIPATVSEATLPLRGLCAPHSKVLVTVSGLQETITTEADADGVFQAAVVFPKEGDYTVSARAQEQGGPLSPPSPSVTFKYAPTWSPPAV